MSSGVSNQFILWVQMYKQRQEAGIGWIEEVLSEEPKTSSNAFSYQNGIPYMPITQCWRAQGYLQRGTHKADFARRVVVVAGRSMQVAIVVVEISRHANHDTHRWGVSFHSQTLPPWSKRTVGTLGINQIRPPQLCSMGCRSYSHPNNNCVLPGSGLTDRCLVCCCFELDNSNSYPSRHHSCGRPPCTIHPRSE